MKIEVIDSIEKLLLYKEEWKSILKEMNNDIVFLELDWIICWWKFFGDKHSLFVLITINDQEVVGICPLMVTKGRECSEISFIGSREADSMDFILKDKYRGEALECICNFLRSIKGKNIIKLHGMSDTSVNYALLKEYIKVNKVAFVSSEICGYYLNTKGNDFNIHFEQRFSKKTRETMNNKEKKLKKLGELNYKKVALSEMNDVFEIHDKRWLRKIGNSSFSKGDTKEFYKVLASRKNMAFNTVVDAITLNNRIISFMYGFECNKKYYFIRIAHDDDFFFLSPGELILKKKIEECFHSQLSVLNFGTGNDSYKAKWSDDYNGVYRIVFPANCLPSKLIFYIKYWPRIKLVNALKKNERVYKFRKYFLGELKLLFSREHITGEILKIIRNVYEDGLLVYITKPFYDLFSKIFSYKQYLVFEKDLERMEISQGELQVKEAAIDDLEALSEVMNEPASSIIRRFTNKNKCFITIYNNEIIHYCWINCARVQISGIDLKLPFGNSEVHIYDIFMKRKFKNQNNCMFIFSSIFNLLYDKNYRRCYVTLDSFNNQSENEIYKEIFYPRYEIIERKLFGAIKHNVIALS